MTNTEQEATMVKLWDMVFKADTLEKVTQAELAVDQADINADEYNDLMVALSYQSRLVYKVE